MVYCSHCGNQIADDVYFCPKCGTKTLTGKNAKVNYPSDQLRDTLYNVGVELEKAFTVAAKETHEAFKKVSEEFQQKPTSSQQATSQGSVICPTCGSNNPSGSVFCFKCGAKLASEASSGSV